MTLEACTKKILAVVVVALLSLSSFGQMSSGKIVFERKTNLKKRLGDNPRLKNFITEENKYRIENFELYFNDSMSIFRPIESDEPEQGMMKYFTTHNTVYQNVNQREKFIVMDLWGNPAYIKDTIDKRDWKVTESKRVISGYNCRKSIWNMNDSTRIYAWFSVEVVPSIGPEGFGGLPGAILGLATEDGSVIYFAKTVEAVVLPVNVLNYDEKGKDVYTEDALKAILAERMKQWMKPQDLEAMFSWL